MSGRDSRTLEAAIISAHRGARRLSYENQSRLAQLMTIWVSGYLEVTCRDVLSTYAESTSDASVARFVGQKMQRFYNPRTREILRLVKSFDEDRARKLKQFIDREELRESVDSVVTLRNRIAHGVSVDTTIANVKIQFEASKRLAGKLKELFDAAA